LTWNGQDPDTFAFNPPIGTGAYTLDSATNDRIIYNRNDNYWGAETGFTDLPAPMQLIWLHAGNEEARAQMMVANELDVAQSVSFGTFDAIQVQNNSVIGWSEQLPGWQDLCPRQIEFNTTVAPWDDRNMREAINLLIDRQQIVDVVTQVGGDALEPADGDRLFLNADAPAGGLARTVTGPAENAREDVGPTVEHVRLGEAALGDEPDVLRHVRVGRAGPLAVHDPVVVVRVGDVGRLHPIQGILSADFARTLSSGLRKPEALNWTPSRAASSWPA